MTVSSTRGAPVVERPRAGPEARFVWTSRHVLVLVVLSVGHVLETVDITITNVALPAIKAGVGFSDATLSWAVNGYTILFGGFLLLCGGVGDAWGRRRVLTGGLALFCVASAVAAVATTPLTLVVGRGLQGLAAAFVAPTTLALLAEVFPEGKPRNAAVGVWAVITTVSGSLGMLAGGLLTDGPGWRWVFWVNVPVAALVIVGGLRFLPVDGPAVRRAGFDIVGAVGLTGGICLLVTAAVTPSPALFAGGVLVLGYATVHELVVARNPLLPKALLRMPSVLAANLTQALCGGGMLVMFYVVTLYQQNVLHYTALQTALAYLPHTAVLVLAARLAPALIVVIGPRRAVCLGAFAGTVGMALLARAPVDGSFATTVLVPSLILGAAIPLTLIPNTTEALAGVPPSLHGAASSLVNVSRVLGGTLSLAVVSAVAAALSHGSLGIPVEAALANGYRVALVVGAGLFFSAVVVAIVPVRRHPRAAMPA